MALRFPRSMLRACALSAPLLLGCGSGASAPPPVVPKPEPAPSPAEAPAPPSAEPAPSAAAAEPAPVPAEPSDEAAPPPSDDDEQASRNVRYVVNPDGLRVRVAGVELVPRAELIQKAGSVGVKLRVEARAEDGKKHSLLAPAGQELAFAAKVRRVDGSEETYNDQREGEREITLDEGRDAQLSRTFPGKGMKPLKNGDELELAVGLWGLGDDAASRRPLRALCKVTLSYPRKKPKLKLTPPDGVGK
jgi:hypothetical protein